MSGPIFSGAAISRRAINLGGVGRNDASSSQQELIQRAKREREGREEARRRERAASKIQAFYRGRHDASQVRDRLRREYDEMMASPSSSGSMGSSELVEATKRLVVFVNQGNSGDLKRLASWSRVVLNPPRGATAKTPLLFSLYSSHPIVWSVLVRQVARLLLQRAALQPNLPQSPLFVEITKILCDPTSFTKWKVVVPKGQASPLEYLLSRQFYELLRKLVLAIPRSNTAHPALPATITLTLIPFKAFPASVAPTSAPSKSTPMAPSSARAAAVRAFTRQILTIPLLPNRVGLPSLTALGALPIEDVLSAIITPEIGSLNVEASALLLASVLAFTTKRLKSFASSKPFIDYLVALRMLLDRLPPALFVEHKKRDEEAQAQARKGKGKEFDMVVIHDTDSEPDVDEGLANEVVQRARARVGTSSAAQDTDGDVSMTEAAPASTTATTPDVASSLVLEPRTFHLLATIASREHLVTLLTLSTRYSATSRLPLAAFLVSLMTTWPNKRDDVLNAIMYSGGHSATERGGGLLRELYRGYVRSGPLGRILGAAAQDRRAAAETIMSSLSNTSLASDWTMVVLLSELYSRCLLTMGDDEFYSTRNPLSLDEVVGLSGLLRNLVFQLYWQEGDLIAQEHNRKIGGTRITIEALRSLATSLLQQIHARDSRRSFTPEDHWLMTSQFDLASFIQTVVYEDEKLDADEDGDASAPMQQLDSDDEEFGVSALSRGPPARRRRAPPSSRLTKRQMSFISPRLGVLNNIPFVIPFETRVAIFRQFVDNDRRRLGLDHYRYDRSRRNRVRIRRTNLAADAFQQMNGLGAGLKSRIEITFIDEHGMEESGIDGGGLFKELLTSLSKEAFDTDRGLWLATQQQELYPNPHAYAKEPSQLAWYTFIGHILGKALYEGILVDVRFAGFFVAKWLGRQSYLDDLQSLDPELYSGLIQLKNYPGDVETDLSLNFTVTDEDFGVSRTMDLIPNGSEIPVTNENRIRYIYLMSHYRLNVQIEKQCAAFFAGLSEIIPERFLRMFNQAELRVLVGGLDQAIDVDDLRANTVYGGFEGEEANETILAFWRVVQSFDKEQRSKLVKFVTSCARPPLLGFKELVPKFALRNAGDDQTRLPTSSTCVNLLKLSEYKDEQTMREKLLYAINSGAGFDLS